MKRERSAAVLATFVVMAATASPFTAFTAESYIPPVTHEDRKDIAVWFGRLKTTGKWCAFDTQSLKRRSRRDELIPGDFGWVSLVRHKLHSITYIQESEDAYVEDRYFIGINKKILNMTRTGHYINDPWVSLTFAPDRVGRLRITADSKQIVQKMEDANEETYFVNWDHFSNFDQIPFGKLIDLRYGVHVNLDC